MRAGVEPWSKVGIIVKASTAQGSAYAAMMLTGGHGVRMQHDFTHDVAPETWRRMLALVLDGLRPRRDAPTPLPAPPLDEAQLERAMDAWRRPAR